MINRRFHWTWWETSNYEESTKRNWHFEKTRSVTTWIHWFQLIFPRQYVRVTPLLSCSSCLVGLLTSTHLSQSTDITRDGDGTALKNRDPHQLYSLLDVWTQECSIMLPWFRFPFKKKYTAKSNFSKVIFSSGLCLNFQLYHV